MNRAIYNGPDIDTSIALTKFLECPQGSLERLIVSLHLNYATWQEPKKNGGFRVIDAPKNELKQVQRAILAKILKRDHFPVYLHGSIQARDYITDARMHLGRKRLIGEDIKDFFPSVKSGVILDVWRGFFRFPDDVSAMLTSLTTYQGHLPQGAPTSSYMANLVMWDIEPELQLKLHELGFTYSRYVDDISISCSHAASGDELRFVQDTLRSTLSLKGLALNPSKQTVSNSSSRMAVHNINVNKRRPTKSKKERDQIRAAVRKCEVRSQELGRDSKEYQILYGSTYGRVSEMSRLHTAEARKLFDRLNAVEPTMIVASDATESLVG